MPRKKKVVVDTTPEKIEPVNAGADEAVETKQTEAEMEAVVVEKAEEAVKDAAEAAETETAEKEAAPKARKPRAKKGTAKKETEKKEAVKKEAVKKETVKKETVKKEDAQEKQVYVQYAGKEYSLTAIEENVKKVWEAEGHRASSIKKLDIYIKPEESAAYYVINGKNAGRIDL